MKTHDRLGRWLFTEYTQNPNRNFVPDARQVRWMQFLNLHGLASSKYLYEATLNTHKCEQTSSRQLRKLFDGRMVYKPQQQRETQGADGNHHVYALTQRGKDYLKQEDLWVDALRQSGPWVHQYMIAAITSSIHILCDRAGYQFIPGHEITNTLAVDVPFKWNGKRHSCKLIPDSLFAIKYGKGFIAYLVEADRNTEPNDPATPFRKSARRNVKQYAEFVGTKEYQKQYSLNCPLVVLNVSVSANHIERTMQIVNEEIGECSYLAFGIAPDFRTPYRPPCRLLYDHLSMEFHRNKLKPFKIVQ